MPVIECMVASRSDGYITPYIPTRVSGAGRADWVHEIEHVRGASPLVRLFARRVRPGPTVILQ